MPNDFYFFALKQVNLFKAMMGSKLGKAELIIVLMILILYKLKMNSKRLCSEKRNGYFESNYYGDSWNSPSKGIDHRYLFSMSINSNDSQWVIMSFASGTWKAHYLDGNKESFLLLRSIAL
jgi:hypothetical protein